MDIEWLEITPSLEANLPCPLPPCSHHSAWMLGHGPQDNVWLASPKAGVVPGMVIKEEGLRVPKGI